ncbi:MAG TPA: TetR/AcrR family transcriptional regulator [Aliidongia sp.]|nr:TetR/AcrR family transcriptional regulator [Aliidongia sp.]
MRVSREQATENRRRIVATAAALFRERGLDGVSIADVMNAVGLTSGGFYKQFESKEALALEACSIGLAESVAALHATAAEAKEAPLRTVVEAYLSAEHRDRSGSGCTLSALAADAGRGGLEMQRVFADGAAQMAEALAEIAGKAAGTAGHGDKAAYPDFTLLVNMVGAVVLARAVDGADPALADHILSGAIEHIAASEDLV